MQLIIAKDAKLDPQEKNVPYFNMTDEILCKIEAEEIKEEEIKIEAEAVLMTPQDINMINKLNSYKKDKEINSYDNFGEILEILKYFAKTKKSKNNIEKSNNKLKLLELDLTQFKLLYNMCKLLMKKNKLSKEDMDIYKNLSACYILSILKYEKMAIQMISLGLNTISESDKTIIDQLIQYINRIEKLTKNVILDFYKFTHGEREQENFTLEYELALDKIIYIIITNILYVKYKIGDEKKYIQFIAIILSKYMYKRYRQCEYIKYIKYNHNGFYELEFTDKLTKLLNDYAQYENQLGQQDYTQIKYGYIQQIYQIIIQYILDMIFNNVNHLLTDRIKITQRYLINIIKNNLKKAGEDLINIIKNNLTKTGEEIFDKIQEKRILNAKRYFEKKILSKVKIKKYIDILDKQLNLPKKIGELLNEEFNLQLRQNFDLRLQAEISQKIIENNEKNEYIKLHISKAIEYAAIDISQAIEYAAIEKNHDDNYSFISDSDSEDEQLDIKQEDIQQISNLQKRPPIIKQNIKEEEEEEEVELKSTQTNLSRFCLFMIKQEDVKQEDI